MVEALCGQRRLQQSGRTEPCCCRAAVLRNTCYHAVFPFGTKTVIIYCVLSYENYNTHTIACCTRLPELLQLAFAFSMSRLCAAINEQDQTSRGFLCALLSQHSQGDNNIDFLWDRNDVTGN